ncbi:hypothetical protein AB4Y40_18665 [Paraburkholderia sp. EG287B]|uniref:hypothetical protein n=1 Tax=Paraburkholderia sp. EG287B TaxID=3237010 RepID=UPI0034D36A28
MNRTPASGHVGKFVAARHGCIDDVHTQHGSQLAGRSLVFDEKLDEIRIEVAHADASYPARPCLVLDPQCWLERHRYPHAVSLCDLPTGYAWSISLRCSR